MAFLGVRNGKLDIAKNLKERNRFNKKYAEYLKLQRELFGCTGTDINFDCIKFQRPELPHLDISPEIMDLEFTFSVYDSYFYNDNFDELKRLLCRCLIIITDFNKMGIVNRTKLSIQEEVVKVQVKAIIKYEHLPCSRRSSYQSYEFFIEEWFRKATSHTPNIPEFVHNKQLLERRQIPWLVIHLKQALQNTRKASNEKVAISRFDIGTLVRSTQFIVHYSFESVYRRDRQTRIVEGNFYHDTRQVELVFERKYLLAFKYSNIRQILIDRKDKIIVHFLLINPPTAMVYVEEKNGDTKTYVKKRVSNILDLPSAVLGRSNMISIELTNYMEFQEIISRLFAKTNKRPIAYVVMDKLPMPAPVEIPSFELNSFSCTYILNAILRRNFVLQLQNLGTDGYNLLTLLDDMSYFHSSYLYDILVGVLRAMDEGLILEYRSTIISLYINYATRKQIISDEKKYLIPPRTKKVWRLVITPTRYMFFPAEISFENRVIRKFNGEFALRVSFRDDDYGKLNNMAAIDEEFVKRVVMESMNRGVTVGNRNFQFLGWSNSQLRDHGVYMYARDEQNNTADSIRSWLGNFSEIKSVSKFMARMGQCFSHTEDAVALSLESSLIETQPDVVGGLNPVNSQPYIFSEGVGKISESLMTEVSNILQFQYVPSAIQFRCAGYKGMLALDPNLTNRDIVFRQSQMKFPCKESQRLEVVSKSSPVPVLLNRQLITILDQQGISAAVFLEIQQEMLKSVTEMLLDGHKAAEYLRNHSALPRLNYQEMQEVGICLNDEPFFRNILLAQHRVAIDGLKRKARLHIEPDKGRNMYGVMDETGILEYGQVFVQYTKEIEGFETNRETVVLTGKVIITKNPCLQPGDVRMLTAVDVEELHHIVDCVVFPQKGPRPHPNEMGGSDLDGDEYTVLWKQELFFRGENTPASHFPIPPEKQHFGPVTVTDMLEFLCHYILYDQVGVIGNAHLARADDVNCGLSHNICSTLAWKFCLAVDFAKNGQKVQLEKDEKPKMYPDFMEKGSLANTYRSRRVLGKLYRVCKDYEEENRMSVATRDKPEIDPLLIRPGWEKYREEAEKSCAKYKKLFAILLNTYGIEDEYQACGKAYVRLHYRAERKELMDIEEIVSLSIRHLWKSFEDEFHKEFGSADASLDDLAEDILQKASAWYMAAYRNADSSFISFPWICWKYLVAIRRLSSIQTGDSTINPFVVKLQTKLETTLQMCRLQQLPLEAIYKCVDFVKKRHSLPKDYHFELGEVIGALRILFHWAYSVEIVECGEQSVISNTYKCSVKYFTDVYLKSIEKLNNERRPASIELILAFLKHCTSLRFVTKRSNNFVSCPIRKQKFLGKKAMSAYHSVAVSGNLVALCLEPDELEYHRTYENEMEPIKIEKDFLKNYYQYNSYEMLKDKLLAINGIVDVNIREIGRFCLISASGTNSSLRLIEKFMLKIAENE